MAMGYLRIHSYLLLLLEAILTVSLQRKFPEDASVRPQLMSSKRTEQLRRLISHLSAPYSTVGYLPEFIDSRSRFIATTLKKLSGGAAPVLGDGLVYAFCHLLAVEAWRQVLPLLLMRSSVTPRGRTVSLC